MSKSGLFVGAVFVAGVSVFGYQLFLQPEAVGHSMAQPDLTGIEDGAAIATVTVPTSFSDNAQIGQRVFEAKCSSCHGDKKMSRKCTSLFKIFTSKFNRLCAHKILFTHHSIPVDVRINCN